MGVELERSNATAAWAVILGGAAAGLLDQLSAFATFIPHGASVVGILRYLASAVIGPRALTGGIPTAMLGLAVHFSLTTAMAGVFVFAAQRFAPLRRWPWVSGPCYGIVLCFVMNYVAVPLSAVANWRPPAGWDLVGALLAHAFYVGLPIAAIASALLADRLKQCPAGYPEPQPGGTRLVEGSSHRTQQTRGATLSDRGVAT